MLVIYKCSKFSLSGHWLVEERWENKVILRNTAYHRFYLTMVDGFVVTSVSNVISLMPNIFDVMIYVSKTSYMGDKTLIQQNSGIFQHQPFQPFIFSIYYTFFYYYFVNLLLLLLLFITNFIFHKFSSYLIQSPGIDRRAMPFLLHETFDHYVRLEHQFTQKPVILDAAQNPSQQLTKNEDALFEVHLTVSFQ